MHGVMLTKTAHKHDAGEKGFDNVTAGSVGMTFALLLPSQPKTTVDIENRVEHAPNSCIFAFPIACFARVHVYECFLALRVPAGYRGTCGNSWVGVTQAKDVLIGSKFGLPFQRCRRSFN
jgi:hypothetical protein